MLEVVARKNKWASIICTGRGSKGTVSMVTGRGMVLVVACETDSHV